MNKHCFKSERGSSGLEMCLKGQTEVLQAGRQHKTPEMATAAEMLQNGTERGDWD